MIESPHNRTSSGIRRLRRRGSEKGTATAAFDFSKVGLGATELCPEKGTINLISRLHPLLWAKVLTRLGITTYQIITPALLQLSFKFAVGIFQLATEADWADRGIGHEEHGFSSNVLFLWIRVRDPCNFRLPNWCCWLPNCYSWV